MRILLITHFFPPRHSAGTENYTLGLAKELISRGHTVSVLCAEDWNSGDSYWNGVTHDTYQGVNVHRVHLNWTKAAASNRVLFDSPIVENWVDDFLFELKPDIMHITSPLYLGIGIFRSARKKSIPLVLTLMDFWLICQRTNLLRPDYSLCDGKKSPDECQDCLLLSSILYKATTRVFPDNINKYIWDRVCISPSLSHIRSLRGYAIDMKYRKLAVNEVAFIPDVVISHSQFLIKVFGNAKFPRNILHIRYGNDLSWLDNHWERVTSEQLRIGYLGQITPIKGVHILVSAFKELESKGNIRLDIWGDETRDRSYFEKLINLTGESDKIRFCGRFGRDGLAKVLQEIDLLVVPSLWYENAPLVIAEAYAAKIPVIASNIGGMAEAVTHEKNGLLFEVGNVTDLAAQLRRVIEEPALLDKLREGIEPVKTVDQEVDELEQIYQSLIK